MYVNLRCPAWLARRMRWLSRPAKDVPEWERGLEVRQVADVATVERKPISANGSKWVQRLICALRVAPWVVFGPITGFMCERALASFRRREPILGTLYVVLNVAILLAIPAITAKLASDL